MSFQLNCVKLGQAYEGDFFAIPWSNAPMSSVFVPAHGKGGTSPKTQVQAVWDAQYLYLRFHCDDDEIVATMLKRDSPLYDEDVVEAFLAPVSLGEYYEFNLSPRNVIFDSFITHDGKNFKGHPNWDCYDVKHNVQRRNSALPIFGPWDGYLAIPFRCLNITPSSGQIWRANFYRIKRQGGDQYLAWSPTHADPANFHIPSKFGELIFV